MIPHGRNTLLSAMCRIAGSSSPAVRCSWRWTWAPNRCGWSNANSRTISSSKNPGDTVRHFLVATFESCSSPRRKSELNHCNRSRRRMTFGLPRWKSSLLSLWITNIGSHYSDFMLYLLLGKKKCRNCNKLSDKRLLFCWLCGCSFDRRICVSGHQNPPWVRYCLTCGKDRSLMSKPHSSRDLNFIKHATKPSTYVPGLGRRNYIFAWLVICLGAAILGYIAVIITRGI